MKAPQATHLVTHMTIPVVQTLEPPQYFVAENNDVDLCSVWRTYVRSGERVNANWCSLMCNAMKTGTLLVNPV
jgi:hypothetical protein